MAAICGMAELSPNRLQYMEYHGICHPVGDRVKMTSIRALLNRYDYPRTLVAISIKAGQANLLLCSYLGIDHQVKRRRRYRLLGAKITFHRHLPQPGETIEYHIRIDRFLKQGEIYPFFFHYTNYINHRPFISMRDECTGFFTEDEVKNSGGIILKKQDRPPIPADRLSSP